MPSLRLVPPLRLQCGDPCEPDDAPSPVAPAEAREPWELAPCPALRALVTDAHASGVPAAVAAALVCELQLVLLDLGPAWMSRLDRSAAAGRVSGRLPAAEAGYLRLLSFGHGDVRREDRRAVIVVDLPARLSSRLIAAGGPRRLIAGGLLTQARSWERAAVLAGRTMSEWAALVALRAVQR